MEALPIFIGYDPREAAAYHVCCQSIIERASQPVAFIPLSQSVLGGFDGQRDGSNQFIFSRFLIPWLMQWRGWALFIDGDMLVRDDVAQLFALADHWKAAQVVKHDYRTRFPKKYIGTPLESVNKDYPAKNWSSVILWNCAHFAHRDLTPNKIDSYDNAFLHRFGWIDPEHLGELPAAWNWLAGEYTPCDNAKLVHHTLGVPGFKHYEAAGEEWQSALLRTIHLEGENPLHVVARAQDQCAH